MVLTWAALCWSPAIWASGNAPLAPTTVAQPLAVSPSEWVARGAALYREGVRHDSTPLAAVRNGIELRGREAACVQCHKASGMGGAEGSQSVPAVPWAVLAAPGKPPVGRSNRLAPALERQTPISQIRPAYTDARALHLALSEGQSPGGGALSSLMPRYRISIDEALALQAYLGTLGSRNDPAAQAGVLHLATVSTQDLGELERASTVTALTDCLVRRSPEAPNAHRPKGTEPVARPRWQLHDWVLPPDPKDWPDTLRQRQAQQPVFAIISGATGPHGRGAWQAVQSFCEQEGLACILPHTPAIDEAAPHQWSFHFSRGVSLEASAIVQHLTEETAPAGGWGRLVVVSDTLDEASQMGARQLLAQSQAQGFRPSATLHVSATEAFHFQAGDVVVVWLRSATLHAWSRRNEAALAGHRIYASAELTEGDLQGFPRSWWPQLRIPHAWDPPGKHLSRIQRNAGRGMAPFSFPSTTDPRVIRLQGHTYTACEVASQALRRMGADVSRTYFVELLEAAEEAATASAYPRFTLGPGQRYSVQGLWMTRVEERQGRPTLRPEGDWTAPP